MKWYEQPYIHKRDWILSNATALDLDPIAFAMVLLIDFYNDTHQLITSDKLEAALHCDHDTVDATIASLQRRHYLTIKSIGHTIAFDLSGLFEYEHPTYTVKVDQTLVDLIQQQFGTLLSSNDIEKLAKYRQTYGDDAIKAALREAMLYGKKNIDYIGGILKRSNRS